MENREKGVRDPTNERYYPSTLRNDRSVKKLMVEPVLKIRCDSCGSQTEHIRSKNVKGEFVYICLNCGTELSMRSVMEETTALEY